MFPLQHKVNMAFNYTNSVNTDISKTFARVRREQLAKASPEAELYLQNMGRALRIGSKRHPVIIPYANT